MARAIDIPAAEYRRRRQRLLEMMEPGSVALLPTAPRRRRNRDVDYPYRPDSDFVYLTGFTESDALLVLIPGREQGESVLFCRDAGEREQLYDGERMGPDRAVQVLGVADAFPMEDADEIVPGLLESRSKLYYAFGADAEFDARVMEWIRPPNAGANFGPSPPGEFVALGHLLHDLRLIKSAAEQRVMREAARINALGHARAMAVCEAGLSEARLEAELRYAWACAGAREVAYPPIVASGANACIMHYTANDAVLRDGDMVLIDAGPEYRFYASDVTRTFPVNGRFSGPQRALYEVVLAAHEAALRQVAPGRHFLAPHQAATRVVVEGLVALGILKGDLDGLLEAQAELPFTVHKISHWLGLDVHDVGDYRIGDAWRELEPGMVMTIEPGLYIRPHMHDVPARFRGIGIRIEDDVLVTRDGAEVLTDAIPRRIDDVEAACAG